MAATIGKVSAVFSASTGGLKSGVNDAIRSFQQLGGEAGSLKSALAGLQSVGSRGIAAIGPAADVAASKLASFQRISMGLQAALAAGRITAEEFATRMGMVGAAAERAAAATARGAAVTAQFETEESRTARTVAELNSLLSQGVISQETHARAMADATGAADQERASIAAAARQMDAMSATFAEGAAVTQSVATAEERHAAEVQRLRGLLAAGAISQETYGRAVDKADDELRQATSGTRGLGAATAAAGAGVERLAGKLNTLIAINAAQLFGQVSAAVGNAARSLISMGAQQAEVIDGQSDLANRLGLTYAELAGLGFAGAQVGVSMESIGKAVTKADVAFVKASQGSKVAQAAFAGVGLSVESLDAMSPAERFKAIANGIAALPTAAERSRAAIQLFGKAGAELLPMFEDGAGAIDQAVKEAERFGLALTQDQSGTVNAMSDSFAKAQKAVEGIVGQVVAYLAPALKGVTDTFLTLVGDIGGSNIGQFIGDGIMQGAVFLASIADSVVGGLSSAWEYAGTVVDVFNRVISAMQAVWYSGEAVFKGVAALLSRSIAGWAFILDNLPDAVVGSGWAEFGASMEASANDLSRAADQAGAKALASANAVVTGEGAPGFGQAGAGPLAGKVRDYIAQAQAEAAAAGGAIKQPEKKPEPQAEPPGMSLEALKATDSRSKEGIAEMFRLMRGGATQAEIAQQQLEEQRRTNELLSDRGEDVEALEMAG